MAIATTQAEVLENLVNITDKVFNEAYVNCDQYTKAHKDNVRKAYDILTIVKDDIRAMERLKYMIKDDEIKKKLVDIIN